MRTIIKLIIVVVLFFSIDINGQVRNNILLGKWVGVSEEIYEMKEESITLDGNPIKADIILEFKNLSTLNIMENGIKYNNLKYKLLKNKEGFTYLFFGNREYLISRVSNDSLILIKSNTVLPMKTVFRKEG